jgi:hypothetical protein
VTITRPGAGSSTVSTITVSRGGSISPAFATDRFFVAARFFFFGFAAARLLATFRVALPLLAAASAFFGERFGPRLAFFFFAIKHLTLVYVLLIIQSILPL